METNTMLDGSGIFEPGLIKCIGINEAHRTPHLFHSQKFWEFIYVDSGFALLGGAENSVLLSEGDLAVIAPGETHSLVKPHDSELYCCLFLDNELGNMKDSIFALPGFLELSIREKTAKETKGSIKSLKHECIRLDFAERQEWTRLCERINRERINKIKGWQELVGSLLVQALVFYSRLDITAKRAERASDTSKGISYEIIKYLENNYNNNITLAQLAESLGFSADYITKQFRAELSLSPSEYLRRYRIAKSMELLCSTELSINDVALKCGFSDMSAFSRVFKMYEGNTPSSYRKRFCR